MVESELIRISKPTSKKLVMLKRMTGIPKCRIIERALQTYIPPTTIKNDKKK